MYKTCTRRDQLTLVVHLYYTCTRIQTLRVCVSLIIWNVCFHFFFVCWRKENNVFLALAFVSFVIRTNLQLLFHLLRHRHHHHHHHRLHLYRRAIVSFPIRALPMPLKSKVCNTQKSVNEWMSQWMRIAATRSRAHTETRRQNDFFARYYAAVPHIMSSKNLLLHAQAPWRLPQTEKKKTLQRSSWHCSVAAATRDSTKRISILHECVWTCCSGDLWLRNADTSFFFLLFLLDYFIWKSCAAQAHQVQVTKTLDHTSIQNSFSIRYTRTNAYM